MMVGGWQMADTKGMSLVIAPIIKYQPVAMMIDGFPQ
jgi:hypothetical protein